MMLSNKRSIFAILYILTTLIYASYGTAISDITYNNRLNIRDNNDTDPYSLESLCKGFRFLYPYAQDDTTHNTPVQIKNDTNVTVMWAKDQSSNVTTCIDCEMLKSGPGLIQIVWTKGVDMTPGYAASSVHFFVSPLVQLPITLVLRAIGQTAFGPRCSCYSQEITITE
ncbi:hypothetical protein F8M41_002843 [Gigaspora margarita]|uniref:Uncharacterized protein n=1 Tax=Gigaspora margarita TaxID=4874 RepID=A0A8H3XF83_GIGMA|nr:hypothetical protein F8M41_002843 [Gigaspora margarita]